MGPEEPAEEKMDRARPGRRRASSGEESLREGRADRATCAAGGSPRRTREVEAEGPGVQGQPQLWETLFQKEEKNPNKKIVP